MATRNYRTLILILQQCIDHVTTRRCPFWCHTNAPDLTKTLSYISR